MAIDNLENGMLLFKEKSCESIGFCEWCGKDIYEDEFYKKIDGDLYCEDCLNLIEELKENGSLAGI